MKEAIVISLGGSVIVPDEVDTIFLRSFTRFIKRLKRRFQIAIICGGGAPARRMIAVSRSLGVTRVADLHWIGIRQTQANAELVRAVLGVKSPVLTAYTATSQLRQRVVVAAGRRPGASTDLGAVILARALGSQTVFNVTNVAGVYSADPRRRRTKARLLPKLSWKRFRSMFGSVVRPGIHAPFDPVAASAAAAAKLQVLVVSKDLNNLKKAIAGKPFHGTLVSP